MTRNSNSNDSSFIVEKKERVVTRLENLSNEVLWEIFDYLDGYDLLNTFSNLNHRFESLIHHPSVSLHLEYHSRNRLSLENYRGKLIEPNKARLRSFYLGNDDTDLCYFDSLIFDASFTRLECLILTNAANNQLLMTCLSLESLPRLIDLSINLNVDERNADEISQMFALVLSLPVLKRCSIINETESDGNLLKVVLPTSIDLKPSSIEYLTIDDIEFVGTILSLFQYLPNIRRLDCGFDRGFDQIDLNSEKVNLPHLKQLLIRDESIRFDQLEVLIKCIGSQLEFFQFSPRQAHEYFDAQRWERLIKTYLPRLKVLNLNFFTIFDFQFYPTIDERMNPFYSQFWIEHEWFPSISIDSYRLEAFSIQSYKKQWFDQHRQIETDGVDSQSTSFRFNQLEFTDTFNVKYDPTFTEKIKLLLPKVPFTHLSVDRRDHLSFLFESAGDSMIHVDSLIITSTPNIDLPRSSSETKENPVAFSSKNRITKVKIESWTTEEEIQYLMDSFPRIEYLELCIQSDTLDATTVLKLILIDRSMKVPNLRSICFEGVKIDRDVLDQLRKIIDGESRIRNYHLRCIHNQIFIQWNSCDTIDF